MTQEDIQLLLVDLCGRLPYSPFVQLMEKFDDDDSEYFREIHNLSTYDIELFNSGEISNIKPYLRPMSSMTEEEKEEFENFVFPSEEDENGNYQTGVLEKDIPNYIDWLNKKMFDFRGLIPKDLALSTEVYDPYKKLWNSYVYT